MEEKIKQIIQQLDALLSDFSVPKNVKKALSDAKAKLSESGEVTVRAGSAVYYITEISEDINLPSHARTQVWRILSALEELMGK